ncbi:MAG TPA: hypothetical protein VJ656_12845 [Pyrinomonadaceae bacterium]|nr:hypothetical protein [Pyrinomonadaceae bacterium]
MKIPLKHGLLITLGVIVWVLAARALVTNPASLVHTLGAPVFFNLLHFIMIYLGLKAMEREKGDRLAFKEGLKTGVLISLFYALTASLFFVGVVAMVGTRWIASEPGFAEMPPSQVAAQAFAYLFIGAMFLGLIYSTVISFFLAKRQSDEA